MIEQSDIALLEELGVSIAAEKKGLYTPREERIIAGFEDIRRFYERHGRLPRGEGQDIFERLYAVRLERLRTQEDCLALLASLDPQGFLSDAFISAPSSDETITDRELLAQLGLNEGKTDDLSVLKHVRPNADKREADEIASREPCRNFSRFRPLFFQVQRDLDIGIRKTSAFEQQADIKSGNWFILGGQKAYVAEKGEVFLNAQNRQDARLRVIFDNGTESNLLMRSLQRALHRDETGRRISDPNAGPLFSIRPVKGEQASGTIYILRSCSDHPLVVQRRNIIHKIGVTGDIVTRRIANARNDPTYLMADVEIVATYKLFHISRLKLEHLIHQFFGAARLDITINDRFGNPVSPQEWYLVPLCIIDEVIERIKNGSITEYRYDIESASLIISRH